MNEPIYRWECTICEAAGEAESSELARRAIDAHVALVHPAAATDRPAADPGVKRIS